MVVMRLKFEIGVEDQQEETRQERIVSFQYIKSNFMEPTFFSTCRSFLSFEFKNTESWPM